MKNYIFIFLSILFGIDGAKRQTEVDFKNIIIETSIDNFLNASKITDDIVGAVIIKVSKLQGVARSIATQDGNEIVFKKGIDSLEMDYTIAFCPQVACVVYDPPSFYFFHKGRAVLIHTGMENFISQDEKRFRDFRKKFKKFPTDIKEYNYLTWSVQIRNEMIVVAETGWFLEPH